MDAIRYEQDVDGVVTLTIDMPGPVNKMGPEFFQSYASVLDRLEQEVDQVTGVILTSGKESFFAGGDLKAMLEYTPEDAEEIMAGIGEIKQLMRRCEVYPRPVVAAINGSALGGGLEICLTCHYRIAMNSPKIRIGLPEAALGLLPGAGGTVRSVYLLGAQNILPIIMEGKQLKPDAAKNIGWIDEIVDDEEQLIASAKQWIKDHPSPKQPWDKSGFKIPGGNIKRPEVAQMMMVAPAMLYQKTKGAYPAPKVILNVVRDVLTVDFEAALRSESRGFIELATGKVAKNMIRTLFFQLNEVKSGKSRPKNIEPQKTKKLGVLGAGMMGRSIALCAAQAGIDVVLKDVTLEAALQGKAYSERARNKEEVLARIHATDKAEDLAGCDLIIEAVFEDIDLKAKVTQESEPHLTNDGVMASNTSTLPITVLAKSSNKPENFIGMHFFSPAEKMPLLEIIVGEQTSDVAIAKAFDFALQIRKTPIVVNDGRGFFTSRVIGTYIDEAVRLLVDGVHPARIERAAKEAGFPVGPLALLDEVSQQLSVKIATSNAKLDKKLGNESQPLSVSYEVSKRLIDEFDRGGKAYGGGFYDYPEGAKKTIWPHLLDLYYQKDYHIDDQDIKERLMFRPVIESIRCVEDGVIMHARDANIGSIFGIGFPPPTGGVLQIVNSYGVAEFVVRLEQVMKQYGERFSPPALLLDKASSGQTF